MRKQFALTVSLLALAVGAVIPWEASTQVARMFKNLSHPIGFALLGGLLVIMISTRYSQSSAVRIIAAVFSLLLAVAIATEAVQSLLPHRSATFDDIVADMLGGIAGSALAWAFHARRRGYGRIHTLSAILISIICFALALWPHKAAALGWLAKPDLPSLIDPSKPLAYWQIRNNRGARITHAKQSDSRSLMVHLDGGNWPGARLFDPRPDWSDCKTLVLEARSGDDLDLHALVRIHDTHYDRTSAGKDRFRTELTLTPERSEFRIELIDVQNMGQTHPARQLDLGSISDVLVFARKQDVGRAFHVYGMFLENCSRN